MSLLTVGGHAIVEMRAAMPRIGVWTADLVVDATSTDGLTGAVTISIADGKLDLKGTAKRVGVHNDTVLMRVLAGAGGMATQTAPKDYDNIQARAVLEDLLKTTGERLSSTADASTLGTTLTRWVTIQQSTGAAIGLLAEHLGVAWRVLADGTVWMGPESWPEASIEAELLGSAPNEARLELGVEAPLLLPGTTFDGEKVNQVEHRVKADSVRTMVWLEAGGVDRSRGVMQGLIRSLLPGLGYYGLYPAKVVDQSDDKLTVDVTPDDPNLPGVSKAQLWLGLPGARVQVDAGAYVLLGWKGGDPSKPFAVALWEPGATVPEIALKATMILLGDYDSGNTVPPAKAPTVQDWIDELADKIETHTHQIKYTFVAGSGGASISFGPLETTSVTVPATDAEVADQGSIAATNVEVK